MAVVGYDFYLNGVKHNAEPVGATYTFDGLSSNTGYSITSVAIDGAGNRSPQSGALTAFTQPPGTTPPPAETPLSAEDISAVDEIVATRNYAQVTPGVLLAITGPRGYYTKAYGNKDNGLGSPPITVDDHFRMASVSKTFASTALLMAVDDGLVSLDDTLEQYIPGVDNGNEITLHHILAMRSGVYNYTAALGYLLGIVLFSAGPYGEDEPLKAIKGGNAAFSPDEEYAYNNSNAILAGEIVRIVRGAAHLRDVYQSTIFDPLGLTETAWPSDTKIPEPKMVPGGDFNPNRAGAAGALTTTIGDFSKWAQAMRDGTLLTPQSHELMQKRFSQLEWTQPPPATFGYGYFTLSFGQWLGHDGSISGFNTACVYNRENGATITVALNIQNTEAFYNIMKRIALYLYPDSMSEPNANARLLRPMAASLQLIGSAPVESNKVVSPQGAIIRLSGGQAPGLVQPSGRGLTVTGGTPGIVMGVPLTYIGSAVSTDNSQTVAIPAHQVGDLIVIFAFADGFTTGLKKPTASGSVPAWIDIDANTGANQRHSRTAYYVATATNTTSGTWSGGSFGTNMLIAVVLRGQASSPIGGHAESGGADSSGATSPGITLSNTDGTSIVLHFGARTNQFLPSWSAAPSGYTSRIASAPDGRAMSLMTKNSTTSAPAVTREINSGVAAHYRGATIEIRAH